MNREYMQENLLHQETKRQLNKACKELKRIERFVVVLITGITILFALLLMPKEEETTTFPYKIRTDQHWDLHLKEGPNFAFVANSTQRVKVPLKGDMDEREALIAAAAAVDF